MKQAEAITHYISLLPGFIEDLEFFKERLSQEGSNPKWHTLAAIAGYERRVGIVTYLKEGDVNSFRLMVPKTAEIRLKRFEAFDRGEDVDPSYCSMSAYWEVFECLAAADFKLARKLAQAMGGRPEIERKHNHPLDAALGYLVKSTVEGEASSIIAERIEDFRKVAGSSKAGRRYLCYAYFFEALMTKDDSALKAGFDQIMGAYRRSAVRDGTMSDDFGDAISLRGIGLTNYARRAGLSLEPSNPYVPEDILI